MPQANPMNWMMIMIMMSISMTSFSVVYFMKKKNKTVSKKDKTNFNETFLQW